MGSIDSSARWRIFQRWRSRARGIHQIQGLPATGVLDVPFTAPGRDRPSVPRLAALKDAQDQLVGVVGRVLTDDWPPRPDGRLGPVGGTGVR
jgi:hypothetical protein